MKPVIYCEVTRSGIHSFFIISDNKNYYMFSQEYRSSVHDYYSKRPSLEKAIDFSKAQKDTDVIRTMYKIPMYIKYLEKEYEIEVLDRSKRRRRRAKTDYNKCA